MKWKLHELGFLPNQDPVQRLQNPAFAGYENLAAELPRLVHERRFREAGFDISDAEATLPSGIPAPTDAASTMPIPSHQDVERLFKLFSYFASAYVHAPGLPTVNRLPERFARPLVQFAQIVDRPPILSYASYCLHNWRRIDPSGPVALGNIALLQNFSTPGDGKRDEDWFILVHVDIEARAGAALNALAAANDVVARHDAAGLEPLLETTLDSLEAMNRTLARMPENCSPDVYFRKVRPYIFGFNDIIYEGCFNNVPQSYRGETGAQSSIIPTLLRAFGITHQNSMLTKHLDDMQSYMPPPHREHIRKQRSVRDLAMHGSPRLKELYDSCLAQIIAFRSKHFDYAVNYIEKKVDNPIATGGTPYVPWLRQLIEETKTFYLS